MDAPDQFWGDTVFTIGSKQMVSAIAESVFNLLKRERFRCRKYKTRKEAREDIFD